MATKCEWGMQAQQLIQLGEQQDELVVERNRLARDVNIAMETNESLEAQVAALEQQRDNMQDQLQTAAVLQVASSHHTAS